MHNLRISFSKERPNHFINVDVPIVSSYRRGKNVEELKTAALYFNNLGLSTYPDHLDNPISIDEEFVFFGRNQDVLANNKRSLEIEFLKAVNRAKLVYVVATNGRIGESSSIEIAWGLFYNAPLAISQAIAEYDDRVPLEIKNIIENNKMLIPILPIESLKESKADELFHSLASKEKPPLLDISPEGKKTVLSSIRSLIRHLEQSPIITHRM